MFRFIIFEKKFLDRENYVVVKLIDFRVLYLEVVFIFLICNVGKSIGNVMVYNYDKSCSCF